MRHAEDNTDPTLQGMCRTSNAWMQTAAMHARNEDYYRGLLAACAVHLGPDVYRQDDGGIVIDPLLAKVPELVARLAALATAGESGPREPRMSGGDDSTTVAVMRPAEAILLLRDADLWITYDPETGYEQHNTEAAGYAALDALLDEHIDRAHESVHEQVESVALYRCQRVAGIVQTVTATSEDDTEDGAWCRERGFDYKVDLAIARESEPAAPVTTIYDVEGDL